VKGLQAPHPPREDRYWPAARYIAGGRRCEERDHRRDLLRTADPAEREIGCVTGLARGRRGVDPPRDDRVDADVVRPVLDAERLHERDDRRLGRPVGDISLFAAHPDQRGQADDRTAGPLDAHLGDDRPREPEDVPDVDGLDRVPYIVGRLVRRGGLEERPAGRGREDVDPAVGGHGGADDGVRRVVGQQVDHAGGGAAALRPDSRDRFVRSFPVQFDREDLGSGGRQLGGDGRPDAAPSAGDDGDLPVQFGHAALTFRSCHRPHLHQARGTRGRD